MDSRSRFLHDHDGVMEGRIRVGRAGFWLTSVGVSRLSSRKIRMAWAEVPREPFGVKLLNSGCQEKLLNVEIMVPVP